MHPIVAWNLKVLAEHALESHGLFLNKKPLFVYHKKPPSKRCTVMAMNSRHMTINLIGYPKIQTLCSFTLLQILECSLVREWNDTLGERSSRGLIDNPNKGSITSSHIFIAFSDNSGLTISSRHLLMIFLMSSWTTLQSMALRSLLWCCPDIVTIW